jgi:membrane protein required for colicin V production
MGDLPINIVDLAVLAVLALSAIVAFVRGCVHEVLSIGAWVGAALATLYGFGQVQPYARQLIAIDLLADIGAGVLLFVVTLILLSLVTRMLAGKVRDSSLGALDRTLGLVFGLARGVVLVAVAWLVLTWALPEESQRPDYLREAKTKRWVALSADTLERLLPETLQREGAAAVDRVKDGAQDAQRARDAYEALSQPKVEGEKPEGQPGYSADERQGMERLSDQITSGGSDGAADSGSGAQ